MFEACSKLEIITTAPREGQENYCYLYDKALYMHVGRTEREILSWIPEKEDRYGGDKGRHYEDWVLFYSSNKC